MYWKKRRAKADETTLEQFRRGYEEYCRMGSNAETRVNLRRAYNHIISTKFHIGYKVLNDVFVPVLPPYQELPSFWQFRYWYQKEIGQKQFSSHNAVSQAHPCSRPDESGCGLEAFLLVLSRDASGARGNGRELSRYKLSRRSSLVGKMALDELAAKLLEQIDSDHCLLDLIPLNDAAVLALAGESPSVERSARTRHARTVSEGELGL